MAIIQDGQGKNGNAGVSSDQRLNVSSRSSNRSFYISRDCAQSYTWVSTFSACTGEEVIYVKNTSSTLKLYIDSISLSSVNAAVWTIFHVTSGTAAGTTITGKNLNLASSNSADACAKGNASVTGVLAGDTLFLERTGAQEHLDIIINDTLILGQNDEIAITYVGTAGVVETTVKGFFDGVD